jgi:hypothetical protein
MAQGIVSRGKTWGLYDFVSSMGFDKLLRIGYNHGSNLRLTLRYFQPTGAAKTIKGFELHGI